MSLTIREASNSSVTVGPSAVRRLIMTLPCQGQPPHQSPAAMQNGSTGAPTSPKRAGFRHLCYPTAALGVQHRGYEPRASPDQTEPITGPLPLVDTPKCCGSRDWTPQVCHASTVPLVVLPLHGRSTRNLCTFAARNFAALAQSATSRGSDPTLEILPKSTN